MITVFMWLPKMPNLGHLSLQLSDGMYISFWPEKQLRWKKTCQGNTYVDDILAEGRSPDEIYCLPPRIVDQDKIKRWWRCGRVMEDKKYNLVLNNCSSVVREALRKGGIYEDPSVTGVDSVSCSIDTPVTVYSWIGVCSDVYLGIREMSFVRQYIASAESTVISWWNLMWNWIEEL